MEHKVFYNIAVSLFFLLLSGHICAQKNGFFSGTVLADDTGETLIGANIKVQRNPSLGIASDMNGNFSLEVPPNTYTFVVSYTGMATDTLTLTIESGKTIEKIIRLKTFTSELAGVEIKVGRFDRKIEDISVSMEIITPDQIEAKNTSNIEEILNYTPGLNILDGEPQIRGGSGFTFGVGSKVGVFIDDMPVLSGDANRPYWELIPLENLKQIEVIKGASSVLSGSSALSGAIYMRTASPQIKPMTKIRVYSGLYTAPKYKFMKWWEEAPLIAGANFLHTQVKNNTDIVIGGNVRYDHGYEGPPVTLPTVKDTITNFSESQMSEKSIGLNFNLKHRNKKYNGFNYGVNGNFMLDKTKMMLAWLDDSAGFYRAYPGAVILQDNFIFYVDPFINYYSKLGYRHSFKSRVMYNDNQMSNDQAIENTVIFTDYNYRREYPNLNDFKFIGGFSTQYTNSSAIMYRGSGSPNNRLFNFSGYAEIEHNILKVINLVAGFRIEYFALNDETPDTKSVFRAGASLKLMQETYLRMSVGQGYRYPTIAERFITLDLGSFGVFENPELIPESSVNAEIGLKQGFKFLNYFGYLDVAVFQQDYKNTIEYLFGFWDLDSEGSPWGFKFMNTGKSRIIGIDISQTGNAQLSEHLTMRTVLGYNYILPKSTQPDYIFATDALGNDYTYISTSVNPEKEILKYRFLHTFKGDIEFQYKGFTPGASFKYFSRIENLDKAIEDFENTTEAAGGSIQPIKYMDYFENNNNGSFVVDVRLSYSFLIKHKISIMANNLANRWYSLRPLKAEAMRSILLQYTLKL
ncbi:MAG: TonB-dependent receptor [Bacteroidales bacterium]